MEDFEGKCLPHSLRLPEDLDFAVAGPDLANCSELVYAIAQNVTILSFQWVLECKSAQRLIDATPFRIVTKFFLPEKCEILKGVQCVVSREAAEEVRSKMNLDLEALVKRLGGSVAKDHFQANETSVLLVSERGACSSRRA